MIRRLPEAQTDGATRFLHTAICRLQQDCGFPCWADRILVSRTIPGVPTDPLELPNPRRRTAGDGSGNRPGFALLRLMVLVAFYCCALFDGTAAQANLDSPFASRPSVLSRSWTPSGEPIRKV